MSNDALEYRSDERYRSCTRCKHFNDCDRSYLECREHIAEQDVIRHKKKMKAAEVNIFMVSCMLLVIMYFVILCIIPWEYLLFPTILFCGALALLVFLFICSDNSNERK